MRELISVIIPVYNIEKYVEKCINSIISQTYRNIELIIVDDGSTDNSPAICDKLAEKDERIKIIHTKNSGLSEARNTGIEAANGQYLMFIDGDDFVDINMIKKMYEVLLSDKSDMVLCDYEYVDEEGKVITREKKEIFDKRKDSVVLNEEMYWKNYYEYDCIYYVISCNKLYKRTIFNNIRFPKGKLHEDEFVFHRVLNECNRISCIRDKFYKYMQRDNSIMAKKISIANLSFIDAIEDRIEYLIRTEQYMHIDYAFSKGVSRLMRFQVETVELNKIEEEAYKSYCIKMKKAARKILFLRQQTFRTRFKALIYIVGGVNLYSKFSTTLI